MYQQTQDKANVPYFPLLSQSSQEEQGEDGDNEDDAMQEGGVEENQNCSSGLGVIFPCIIYTLNSIGGILLFLTNLHFASLLTILLHINLPSSLFLSCVKMLPMILLCIYLPLACSSSNIDVPLPLFSSCVITLPMIPLHIDLPLPLFLLVYLVDNIST